MPPIDPADLEAVLEEGRPDLEDIRGQHLLVTGATGFVGSWLLETAAYANRVTGLGIRVTALVAPGVDLRTEAPHLLALDGVTFIEGDVCTIDRPDMVAKHPELGAIDSVIHAAIAVDAATIGRNPMPTLDSAVEGTRRTLALAQASGARRFLFLSSGAVYGQAPPGLEHFAESYRGAPDPTDPAQVYAEGKRIGEMMCACVTRAYGMETVIARLFAFVGPHLRLDRHYAVGNFMRDALSGQPIVVKSDGTAIRSYLYAGDMATWLWALLRRGESGRAYNVGSSRAVSIAQLAAQVAELADPPVPVQIEGVAAEDAPRNRYLPDLTLVKESLAVRETVSLEDALARTMRWHRRHA